MAKKYKVDYDRPNCIGAGACAAAYPKRWEMNYDKDGKADLIGGKDVPDGKQELEFDEDEFKDLMESAEICPVNVIHILKEKKKLI